ncbi:MAG: aminotransferase class I/II-fold pyridoxal phosphate-dependent enzyme [Streptosporangiaceae bacterium]
MATISGRTFGSDNHAGVYPAVLAALAAANSGDAVAYGEDTLSKAAVARLCALARARQGYLVFNGTGANVLALSLLLRPHEAVICAESSHLNIDECGAPERILGCKLVSVAAPHGKLTPELIAPKLTGIGDEHRVQPRVIQIAQATELGTCYSLAELRRLQEFARAHGLLTYLDGARIANAAAYLDCSLADIAACADVLSFGGTKSGALGVEAVLVMADGLDASASYHRKQVMQLVSKMRFLAAQIDALLDEDRWVVGARIANARAGKLAAALGPVPGVRVAYPVQSNGVFTEISRELADRLLPDWSAQVWSEDGHGTVVLRWMTAFDTEERDVAELATAIAAQAQAVAALEG